ncbi:MAG: N-methyl-L-tryptophan oxidase [Gemmatimonadaceae bacterium]
MITGAYDVIVVGLGVMGCATTYTLAKRGKRVLAIDKYPLPHQHGSSHGKTRMIREAYSEGQWYVPLVRRSYQLWEELGHEAGGRTFLVKTGGLYIGPSESPSVKGALASAMQYRIPHEVLSAGKLHRRFPAFSPLDDWVGVYELRAGVLHVDGILDAYHALARAKGAEFRFGEEVRAIESASDGVRVTTGRGTAVASQVVVAVGPWAPTVLQDLALPLTIERQVSHWFEPARDEQLFGPDRMPVSVWEYGAGKFFFTLPNVGDGVKVGLHHGGEATTAETIRRVVSPDELAGITDMLRRFLPFAKGHLQVSSTCLNTNTPDGHFIVDRHPGKRGVIVMSPCSGHGFKFAPVLAECVADLVDGKAPAFDLSAFSLSPRRHTGLTIMARAESGTPTLLAIERDRAERLLNGVRLVVLLLLGMSAVVYSSSLSVALDAVNVAVLLPMLAWTLLQYWVYYRRPMLPEWLSLANPIVDITAVTCLLAGYGVAQSASLALKTPMFAAYFIILAALPVASSTRKAGTVATLAVAEYATLVIAFLASGRLGTVLSPVAASTAQAVSPLDEGAKVLLLACAGAVATYATRWQERLSARYSAATRESAQPQSRLAQAQLQALRLQLNPHFLFNTLNTITALVHTDPQAAERMIMGLSELLRISLGSVGEQEVPLSRELEVLEHYLDIQQVRFADRLRVQYDVATGTEGPSCQTSCCSRWWKTRSSTGSRRVPQLDTSPSARAATTVP